MSDTATCTNCKDSAVTADCTVNAAIAKTSGALAVLNRFGIDTCCGGRASIADAAIEARIDPIDLLAALNRSESSTAPEPSRALPQAASCSCGCR